MDRVMDFDHQEFTDQLSDYLDGELPAGERAAIDAHLASCARCTAVLADLKSVVARARGLEPRPPRADLWPGIAARLDQPSAGKIVAFEPRRRVSLTMPQLAAAAAILIAVSAGLAWQTAERMAGRGVETQPSAAADPPTAPVAQPAGEPTPVP